MISSHIVDVATDGVLTYIWNGRSPGKRLRGLQVIPAAAANNDNNDNNNNDDDDDDDDNDGNDGNVGAHYPSLFACIMRACAKTLLWLCIPVFWLPMRMQQGADGGGHTLHDALAGTTVVYRPALAAQRRQRR